MTVVEIRDRHSVGCGAPATQQQTSTRKMWPLFVVALGLAATVAWTALLGWTLYWAVQMLLA